MKKNQEGILGDTETKSSRVKKLMDSAQLELLLNQRHEMLHWYLKGTTDGHAKMRSALEALRSKASNQRVLYTFENYVSHSVIKVKVNSILNKDLDVALIRRILHARLHSNLAFKQLGYAFLGDIPAIFFIPKILMLLLYKFQFSQAMFSTNMMWSAAAAVRKSWLCSKHQYTMLPTIGSADMSLLLTCCKNCSILAAAVLMVSGAKNCVCRVCLLTIPCAVGILQGVEHGADMLFSMFPNSPQAISAAGYARTRDIQSLGEEYAKNLRTMVSGELPRRVRVLSYCVSCLQGLPA